MENWSKWSKWCRFHTWTFIFRTCHRSLILFGLWAGMFRTLVLVLSKVGYSLVERPSNKHAGGRADFCILFLKFHWNRDHSAWSFRVQGSRFKASPFPYWKQLWPKYRLPELTFTLKKKENRSLALSAEKHQHPFACQLFDSENNRIWIDFVLWCATFGVKVFFWNTSFEVHHDGEPSQLRSLKHQLRSKKIVLANILGLHADISVFLSGILRLIFFVFDIVSKSSHCQWCVQVTWSLESLLPLGSQSLVWKLMM